MGASMLHAVLCAVVAASWPAGLQVDSVGGLRVGEVTLRIQHFSPGWHCAWQTADQVGGRATEDEASWRLDGTFATLTGGEWFAFRQELRRAGERSLSYEANLTSPAGIATEQLALGIELPVASYVGVGLGFDQETFILPVEPFAETFLRRDVRRIEVPTRLGRLVFEGDLSCQIQDGRNFADRRHFRMRLHFQPASGRLTASRLAFELRLEPYHTGEQPDFGSVMRSVISADEQWQPISHEVFSQPGGVLDWSSLVAESANLADGLVIRDGRLEPAGRPGQRVRLYGTNLCDRSCFPSQEEADKLAAQLRRAGYNSVRLHHYDRHLAPANRPLSEGFDPEKLDRLDYLFAALKREGLAVTIDLYTVRPVPAGAIAEVDRQVWLHEFKALVAISPTAMANWQAFSRLLLTHVNPYTQLAWKDDPALFSICLLNEDVTLATWNAAPDIAALYRARYEAWLRERGGEAGPVSWGQFLIELNQRMAADCEAFVRGLGTRALLTSGNFRQNEALSLVREAFELVDNHSYHDLKKFLAEPWRLPYGHHQRAAAAHRAALPRDLFAARLFGRPYTVTEFNYCYPNHHRAEGGVLMGAYAALQDWDGVYRYAYSHSVERTQTQAAAFYLDTAGDPLNLLSDRIGILLFRRGDVRPATDSYAYQYSADLLTSRDVVDRQDGFVPEAFGWLGLISRVGSVRPGAGIHPPADCRAVLSRDELLTGGWPGLRDSGRLAADRSDPGGTRFVSDTGELDLHCGEVMRVLTPRTECLVFAGAREATADRLTVTTDSSAVVAVSAIDDEPLAESRRLVLFHLTDVQNSGVRFSDPEHTVLEAWGELPHLVRRGAATVTIRFAFARPTTIWACDLAGARQEVVPHTADGAAVTFPVSTVNPSRTTLVYELERW